MKKMFQINKVLLIINLILFIPFPLGMLFMMVLGLVQIISSIWLLGQRDRLSQKVKSYNITHLLLSGIVLLLFYLISSDYIDINYSWYGPLFITGMVVSGILALFFIYISYLSFMENENKSITIK